MDAHIKRDEKFFWNIETIDDLAFCDVQEFEKEPKGSYSIDNTLVNQIDLPMCYVMFRFQQFILPCNFEETPAHKHMKIRFHANLAQDDEKVWTSKNIIKIFSITKDEMGG